MPSHRCAQGNDGGIGRIRGRGRERRKRKWRAQGEGKARARGKKEWERRKDVRKKGDMTWQGKEGKGNEKKTRREKISVYGRAEAGEGGNRAGKREG